MNIPEGVFDWLNGKINDTTWATVKESRNVEEEFYRQTGGRIMYAGVSISIEPAEVFSIEVETDDIYDDFIAGARDAAIRMLLFESRAPILKCKVRLYNFRSKEGEASYKSFYCVAIAAMKKLLGLTENTEHNILW